jgi:RNA polymerase sigma factor (sigma-70 family)
MAVHFYRELLNFCAHTLQDRDAASDVVQETYARVIALGRSQAVAEPRALLYRVARNLLTDRHRRERMRDHESLDALTGADCPHARRDLQPEEALDASQYTNAMLDVIDKLPARCREAFVLNRFEGLTHAEVASRMGISRNMVAQHVIRAVLACKACDDRLRGVDASSVESLRR